ncbi:hypothetical protein PAXRUDRAFT_824479 [Paxillus rubicundulus Ve08.2h10]|uniref:BTB domain-containing protein n=1 Tax=Paxillus rubicundulus Ve08.2h10 TaxID=930991 RepID=A0A0D0E1X9_9AGAM|nr:hypothetical protein PAXRUDRAFT_824479 [Paxillus rubicundulus Ve08.2h10]
MTKSEQDMSQSSKSSLTPSHRLWCASKTGLDVYVDGNMDLPQRQSSVASLETVASGEEQPPMQLTVLRGQLQRVRFANFPSKASPGKPAAPESEQSPDKSGSFGSGFKTTARKAAARFKFLKRRRNVESVHQHGILRKRRTSIEQQGVKMKAKAALARSSVSSIAESSSTPITFQLVVEPWLADRSKDDSLSSIPVSATQTDEDEDGSAPQASGGNDGEVSENDGAPVGTPHMDALTCSPTLFGPSSPPSHTPGTTSHAAHGSSLDPQAQSNSDTAAPLDENETNLSCADIPSKPCRQVQKHDRFWIADGNIVIEADNTQFQLHRSRLVEQSPLFAQAFGEPCPTSEEMGKAVAEELEFLDENGGKVYRLKNVTASDWAVLLELDRDLSQFHFTTPTLPVLSSLLRASTCLRFDRCRALAIKFLEIEWSCSLDNVGLEKKAGAIDVAVLGRKCGVKGVLPRAFYELARADGGYGLGSNRVETDTVRSEPGEEKEMLEGISKADLALIGRVREHMVLAWAQTAARLSPPCIDHTSPDCPSIATQRETWERRVHDSGVYQRFLFDPICGLQTLADIDWEEDGWCQECVRVRREVWSQERQKLWEWLGAELEG